MSVEDEAKKLLMKMGMWWPDANSGTLRAAAGAWRTFAGSVDDVRTPVNNAATSLIHNNKGEAIAAFGTFWGRYAGAGDTGWLSDLAKSARGMADALDAFADAVDDAINKLWTQIGIDATVIVAGIGLAFFTAGISAAASAAATDAIIDLAGTLGIAVSTTVAEIAGTTLAAAAFGGMESVTVDLAIAQPLKIATGLQQGLSLDEVNEAAESGMIFGGGSAASPAWRRPRPGSTRPTSCTASRGRAPRSCGPTWWTWVPRPARPRRSRVSANRSTWPPARWS